MKKEYKPKDKLTKYPTDYKGICLIKRESYECFEPTPGNIHWEWVTRYELCANRFLPQKIYELILFAERMKIK